MRYTATYSLKWLQSILIFSIIIYMHIFSCYVTESLLFIIGHFGLRDQS